MKKKPSSIRKGVAAILFRRKEGRLEFLVMHRVLRWEGWETLKGGIEPGENSKEALFREIEEELNIQKKNVQIVGIVSGAEIHFRIPLRFRGQMGGFSSAYYTPFYLVEIPLQIKPNLKNDNIGEHDKIMFVSYNNALKTMTYSNTRAALRKAKRMLSH